MDQFYVRHMTRSDVPFFMNQCEESARDKHLHINLLDPKENKVFEKQIKDALKLNEAGHHSGHFLLMLIREVDDQQAGFMWVRASKDLTGTACIEISVIHVVKSMRGNRGGSILLSIAIDGYKEHRITAKCYPASINMSQMLKRRGFEVMGTSERGSEYLCLLPSSHVLARPT